MIFDQMEDNQTWLPNMVLNGKFSQPYSQYPVWARALCQAVYPLYIVY